MPTEFVGIADRRVNDLIRGRFRGFVPPPDMTTTGWAEERRVLSRKDSARPGRWRSEPHQPGIMDAMSDRRVRGVVLMGASQFTGKSQMMNNAIGRDVDLDPCNMMAIFPTLTDADKWSKGRLDPMCEATPCLRDKIPPRKVRDGMQTILHRQYPGGQLFIVGSNAPSGLAAQSVRKVYFDEVDRFEASAGDEGDPIELGLQRTVEYKHFAKFWMSSTPLIEGASRIAEAYAESDQRVWQSRCPHCSSGKDDDTGYFQILWDHVHFQDEEGHKRPDLTHVECPLCGAVWDEPDRLLAIETGRWLATAPFNGVAGFHINAFGCRRADLRDLAGRFVRALGNAERMKAFVNLVEARTWRPKADAPPWESLLHRRETWSASVLPAGVLLLTAAADVQKDRLEARVWGWGRNAECWHIETRVFIGNTARDEVWKNLDAMLDEHWQAASGVEIPLDRLAVDSGAFTEEVYRWAKPRRSDRRLMLVKGMPGQAVVLGVPAATEVTRLGKRAKYGVRVWPVGGAKAKAWFYEKMKLPAPGEGDPYPPGYVHLSTRAGEDEIKQLTAEEQRTGKDKYGRSRIEWHLKPGQRNEGLDCLVYSYAAAIDAGLWRNTERAWARLEQALGGLPPAEPEETPAVPAPAAADPAETEKRARIFGGRVIGSGNPYLD